MDNPFPGARSLPAADGATLLPPTLDGGECAALLRCSKATVEELAARGAIPATRFGRGWVFVTEQILAHLKERCEREAMERRCSLEVLQPKTSSPANATVVTPGRRGRPRKAIPHLG